MGLALFSLRPFDTRDGDLDGLADDDRGIVEVLAQAGERRSVSHRTEGLRSLLAGQIAVNLREGRRDTDLVADHGGLIEIVEDALENGQGVSVEHLAEHVCELVLEESVLILEACIVRKSAEEQEFGSGCTIAREGREAAHTWR